MVMNQRTQHFLVNPHDLFAQRLLSTHYDKTVALNVFPWMPRRFADIFGTETDPLAGSGHESVHRPRWNRRFQTHGGIDPSDHFLDLRDIATPVGILFRGDRHKHQVTGLNLLPMARQTEFLQTLVIDAYLLTRPFRSEQASERLSHHSISNDADGHAQAP